MKELLNRLEQFFSMEMIGTLSLYDILSTGLKYVFVLIIYYFIFQIIRLIYLDIKSIGRNETPSTVFLRLITRPETLGYKVNEIYYLNPKNTIGRGEENTIVLKDRFISKRHLRIEERNREWFVIDEGSANGTYINDKRIAKEAPLHNRDVLRIGDVELLYVNEVAGHVE